jgi:hypothetical protein
MRKKKYRFQAGGSTDFFNQIASMYAQQFNDAPDEDDTEEYVLPEEVNGEPADYNQEDYDELLNNYTELQAQFDQLKETQKNLPDDNFLDFLFSDQEDNLPVNPDALRSQPTLNNAISASQSGVSSGGVNPFLLQTKNDLFSQYKLKDLGVWGDKSHQQRKSDHNTGDAQDFGFDSPETATKVIDQLQKEAGDRNIKYIIYNKQIWNPSISNEWRPYTGSNPHDKHIHVSYKRQNGGKYQTGGSSYLNTKLPVATYKDWNEVNAANIEARRFSKDHNLLYANDAYVAKKPGDPVVQYTDMATGLPYDGRYGRIPQSMIKPLPDWVEKLEWDKRWNQPYYKDGEDMIFVDKKHYNSPRFISPQKPDIAKLKRGGIASTPAQQYQGLNDTKYNQLLFPMQGFNTFRGLDNGQPVMIEDMLGQKRVLKGKYDTAQFYGAVKETRI